MRVIISGGGTGGHIFPAIAIADALKAAHKDVEILFVGADGRMEMENQVTGIFRQTYPHETGQFYWSLIRVMLLLVM